MSDLNSKFQQNFQHRFQHRFQQQLQQRFQNLPPRDRQALTLLAGVLALIVLIYGIALPSMNYHTQARDSFQQEQQLFHWLQAQQPAVQALASHSPKSTTASDNPLTLVNNSAKDFQLSIKRLQPENNGNLRVWMENVNFDNTLQWLHYLQQNGLSLSDVSIDDQGQGLVSVRVTFE